MIFILSCFILAHVDSVSAVTGKNSSYSPLFERKLIWPDWNLPAPLKYPRFKEDLIYPSWFLGKWDVASQNIKEPQEKIINYQANFLLNESEKVIADRDFNTKSISKQIFNNKLLIVRNDPDSPNHQFAEFIGDRFIESKIVGRSQEETQEGFFLSDELTLQILHTPDLSKISKVETLNMFRKCHIIDKDDNQYDICGEQWQMIYQPKDNNIKFSPQRSENFILELIRSQD